MIKKDVYTFKLFLFLVFILLSVNLVIASDVAYVYKSSHAIDENIVEVFEDLGLTVENIQDSDVPSTNFSDYRIIFIGDERFRKAEFIPIDEKPTVIANYYRGEEFGLTDYDGVSKLASTSPLNVKKDGNIIQVYTQAEYSLGGISIPYYYLDDENKAPGFETEARTYTGGNNGYDFGDVISYANAGTELVNGMTTQAKICFFGIIESDYWTPEARDMFEDCIGYVAITCESDSDCPDVEVGEPYCSDGDVYQDVEEYECENPGTVYSECVDDVIPVKEVECGEPYCDTWGENYCTGEDVYHSRTCYTPSCSEGECAMDSYQEEEIVEECVDVCVSGECREVTCYNDTQCGITGLIGEEYCTGEDLFQDYQTSICLDAGTPESSCDINISSIFSTDCGEPYCDTWGENYCTGEDIYHSRTCYTPSCSEGECAMDSYQEEELVEECVFECVGGVCGGECDTAADCGITGLFGEEYCTGEDLFQDYKTWECLDAGTPESTCNFNISSIFSTDCGEDSCNPWGDNYCIGDDVYHDRTCHDLGCSDDSCFSNDSLDVELVEVCDDICVSGACRNITCYEDIECDDSSVYTIDECENPGTIESYCFHTPVNCVNDNDCGITGLFGEEYCLIEDIFKNYQASTCVNAGTRESYCDILVEQRFLVDCGEDSCDPWGDNYCIGDDVYHDRTCYERGCSDAACILNLAPEEELVEECAFECVGGLCQDECSIDSDCGADYNESTICYDNDEYHNFHDFFCTDGGCNESIIFEFENDCGENSTDPWGNNYCIGNDSWHNRTTYERGCSNDSCFTNSGFEDELVEACEFICVGGSCEGECNNDSDCDSLDSTYCSENNFIQEEGICVDNYCEINTTSVESCDNDLFCDGVESCDDMLGCQAGTPVSCVAFDIFGVSSCDNVPDGNPLTFDFREAFTSTCDEDLDSCTIGSDLINSECNESCGAECSVIGDCAQKCTLISHKLYNLDGCTGCECEYSSPQCVVGECGAECDEDSDCSCEADYCDGSTLVDYPDYSSCGTAGSEGCLCQTCEATLIPDSPQCYVPECGNNILDAGEECDDGNLDNGDGCSSDCEIEECIVDEDCDDDYYESNICYDDDEYSYFHDFSCETGICVENVSFGLAVECGEDSTTTWGDYYCSSGDVYVNRTISERGCEEGSCFLTSSFEDILIGDCALGCDEGKCLGCVE